LIGKREHGLGCRYHHTNQKPGGGFRGNFSKNSQNQSTTRNLSSGVNDIKLFTAVKLRLFIKS
jgi:hypothetical protein